mgnify:FL=1
MNGILFDFNGTMFLDSPFHWLAWQRTAKEVFGIELDEATYRAEYHGTPNLQILRKMSGGALSAARMAQIAEQKEEWYREACLANPEAFHLTPGLPALLDALREKGAPMAIGTSVGLSNIEFYFEHLGLGRWFTMETVAYDHGAWPGKPEPDVFLEAARRIGCRAEDCMGFEDSYSGITALKRAGVKRIYCVDGDGEGDALERAFPDIIRIADFTGLAPKTLEM